MTIGIIYGIIFWLATIVLVLGIVNKMIIYARIPAPLKIPTTPAPISQGGVIIRTMQEVFLFKSLFRSDKLLWLLGILFHYAMLFIVLRHFRYVVDTIEGLILFMQPIGKYAGFVFVLALVGLLLRRILIDRVRYISSPSDSVLLLLLISIATTGLFMQYVSHPNIIMVREFCRGLIHFDWQPLPADLILLTHLGLVATLMFIFPISKLIHAPGLFFSPTQNQIDNPREKRHISHWARSIEENEESVSSRLKK